MPKVKSVHLVYAQWCPHCVPLTVDAMKKVAAELRVPLVLHDIDTNEEEAADRLVERYGDWDPDYTIPQVFVEFDDGQVKHILTGKREGLAFTRRAIEDFVRSPYYASLRQERRA